MFLISNSLFDGPVVNGQKHPTLFIATLNALMETCKRERVSMEVCVPLIRLVDEIRKVEVLFNQSYNLLWQQYWKFKEHSSPTIPKKNVAAYMRNYKVLVEMNTQINYEPIEWKKDIPLSPQDMEILKHLFVQPE